VWVCLFVNAIIPEPFEIIMTFFMRARYDRKWLHSDALRSASGDIHNISDILVLVSVLMF